jgi:putative pyruvate formate lyase activating enzyme
MEQESAMPLAYNGFEPGYLRLWRSGELQRRVNRAVAGLADCLFCPRACHIDRLHDKTAVCKTGRYAWVSSYFAHFGEEDCLRGTRGSGTIFFSWCNLRCVFCQNFEVSWRGEGRVVSPQVLAGMMLELQNEGCHNINLVTPEHVVPQVLEALPIAVEGGLRLPLVYNTGAYDSIESLALLEGIIDIYMPDFKFWDSAAARRYAQAANYPAMARAAIREMHRQVGPLLLDESGIALHGVLLRHLVMPGEIAGTRQILGWIAHELGPDTYVNLMAQYRPAGLVDSKKYPEINRPITCHEFQQTLEAVHMAGLTRLDAHSVSRALR